uniref:Uncharacterized protein n=1 Tax=Timema douglasi TaxID=61478 RepID=A0A7R8VI92_TIMDO|nr:unnamed protein product [Timema douglasi]
MLDGESMEGEDSSDLDKDITTTNPTAISYTDVSNNDAGPTYNVAENICVICEDMNRKSVEATNEIRCEEKEEGTPEKAGGGTCEKADLGAYGHLEEMVRLSRLEEERALHMALRQMRAVKRDRLRSNTSSSFETPHNTTSPPTLQRGRYTSPSTRTPSLPFSGLSKMAAPNHSRQKSADIDMSYSSTEASDMEADTDGQRTFTMADKFGQKRKFRPDKQPRAKKTSLTGGGSSLKLHTVSTYNTRNTCLLFSHTNCPDSSSKTPAPSEEENGDGPCLEIMLHRTHQSSELIEGGSRIVRSATLPSRAQPKLPPLFTCGRPTRPCESYYICCSRLSLDMYRSYRLNRHQQLFSTYPIHQKSRSLVQDQQLRHRKTLVYVLHENCEVEVSRDLTPSLN